VPEGARLEVLTARDEAALQLVRHTFAHVLAQAVRDQMVSEGFPARSVRLGIGPTIEHGFYYDFDLPRSLTPDDLPALEERMRALIHADLPLEKQVVPRDEALARYRALGDPFKTELIEDLPEGEVISFYRQGGDDEEGSFVDLCRGPHVPSTGRLKHFKLLHAAGAYWRGDEKRQMLQRIYGTAWFKKEDLDAYLHRLEEARRRDHRVLGKQLDLFSIQETVGPGLVFWHPKGAIVRWLLTRAVEDDNVRNGYELVYTPNITREEVFKISGHLPLYEANQYPPMAAGHEESDDIRYRVKPMNCPMHALIYKSQQRSYRDLPVRLSEVANVYRNERSGVLHGLLRVRGLSMDDAHIFCTLDQVEDEIFLCLDQVDRLVRETFGFELDFEVSTRPPERLGDDAVWDRAEAMLKRALERKRIAYRVDEGGGAFYGPKIDIKFRDAIGRLWQGPTIQLDFNLPERFQLEYTGADNRPHRPAMIHRAIYGTLERFIGNLIEHFAGAFPVWLAPEQVRVIPISDAQADAARKVAGRLEAAGLRVHVDDRGETLNYRIREGELQKVPYMVVIGQREAEADSMALRVRGAGKKQEIITIDDFLKRIGDEVQSRALVP
jgi:threonyl-tRNA synthetase